MIQFDKDGVTLFYSDATGKKISHSWMDGKAYADMLTVRDAQQAAIRENAQTAGNYATALANAQLNVNNGHADTVAPPKPTQKMVSDTGAVTFAPFDPPLADLIPAAPSTAPGTMFAAGAGPAAADLKSDIQFNMIQAMFRKMFPEA